MHLTDDFNVRELGSFYVQMVQRRREESVLLLLFFFSRKLWFFSMLSSTFIRPVITPVDSNVSDV